MNGTIDLASVAVFVRVAETASFRGAADALGIPRSTVSRRVAALEKKLGTRLLKRTTRDVSLTDAGAAYLRSCQPALDALEEAARAVSSTSIEARGRLRITTAVTFGERFLGPIIEEYLRANPHVEVEVLLADRHVDLVQEGFDVAFRGGGVGDDSLVARELGRAPVRCFASPSYLEGRQRPRRPADLEAHDCIVYPPLAPGGRWSFRVNDRTVHTPVRGRLVVNSLPLSLEAAVRGVGIARAPMPLAVEPVRSGALVELLAPYVQPPSPFFVVYPSGVHTAARVRAFIEVATKYLVFA
jgi:DNA-binding transcriptional LysR family regulator